MRFFAKHRKIMNAVILVICVALFVFFAKKTLDMKNDNIEVMVYPGSAMGTSVKKTIYADHTTLCDQVDRLIDDTLIELDNQLSVRNKESEIYIINKNYVEGGENQLSDDLVEYLKTEKQIAEETHGAFSPCIHPLVELWGIEDGFDVIPDAALIEETRKHCDANNLEIIENGIIFHDDNMGIDLGAAGKGIACDVLKEKLKSTQIKGAVVAIGGSILVYGDKGNKMDWHVAIQDPRGAQGDVLGIVDIDGEAMISTSGDYEKYFEVDGKRYHHIFDPNTGYPVDNGLISVTIVCDSGILSDALSTACFVMGLEEGMEYAETKGVEAVFVTDKKEVYMTKGIKNQFRLQSKEYILKN